MKPLLRAVLILDALLFFAFGGLFLLTPWTSLYGALHLAAIEPALAGQLFGLALLGLGWLALYGVINGAITAAAARIVGHVTWLTGIVILVWLIALRTSLALAWGALATALAGAALLIVGLAGVRLAGAVRRRDKAATAAHVAKAREPERVGASYPAAGAARPVEPTMATAEPAVRTIDPVKGSPVKAAVRPSVEPAAAPLSPSQQVARDEARDAAADLPGSPRPPFHG
jgi:hypothetical protein